MDVRAASSGAAEGIFGDHAIPGFRRLRQYRQHCLQLPGTFEDPRKTLRIARKRLAGAHIEPVILRKGTSGICRSTQRTQVASSHRKLLL